MSSDIDDDSEQATSRFVNSLGRYVSGAGGCTYMKLMIATTLMIEKKNSASPYPRTPKRFIAVMIRRNRVTKSSLLNPVDQYSMATAPAMTSNGSSINHWNA